MAAHALKRDKSYPITLDEAIEYFSGVAPPIDAATAPIPKERMPVLDMRNVTVRYRTFHKQTKMAVNQLSTSFYKGDQVALVGNNGAGKSSLLKILGGIVKPSEGEMELSGIPLKKFTPETLSNHIAFVFQNAEEMFIDDSVRKEIEYYLKARKVENLSPLVDQLLEDFDLIDFQHQDARLLSGGQQRRCFISDWRGHASFYHYSG